MPWPGIPVFLVKDVSEDRHAFKHLKALLTPSSLGTHQRFKNQSQQLLPQPWDFAAIHLWFQAWIYNASCAERQEEEIMPEKLFAPSQKPECLLFGVGVVGSFCLCVFLMSVGMETFNSTPARGLLLTTHPTKHGLHQRKKSSKTVQS